MSQGNSNLQLLCRHPVTLALANVARELEAMCSLTDIPSCRAGLAGALDALPSLFCRKPDDECFVGGCNRS